MHKQSQNWPGMQYPLKRHHILRKEDEEQQFHNKRFPCQSRMLNEHQLQHIIRLIIVSINKHDQLQSSFDFLTCLKITTYQIPLHRDFLSISNLQPRILSIG